MQDDNSTKNKLVKEEVVSSIGFRCFPEGFACVILKGTQVNPEVVTKDKFLFPSDRSWTEKLVWARKQVFEILEHYELQFAALKSTEPFSKNKSLKRAEVDGVIKEAVCAKTGLVCNGLIMNQIKLDIANFNEPSKYAGKALAKRGLSDFGKDVDFLDSALAALTGLPKS